MTISMPHTLGVRDPDTIAEHWARQRWPYTHGVTWTIWTSTSSQSPTGMRAFSFADRAAWIELRGFCHGQGLEMHRLDMADALWPQDMGMVHVVSGWPYRSTAVGLVSGIDHLPRVGWLAAELGADSRYHTWAWLRDTALFVNRDDFVRYMMVWG